MIPSTADQQTILPDRPQNVAAQIVSQIITALILSVVIRRDGHYRNKNKQANNA
ncbi:unnamed protein product [marine sediment metagenome]|uniref:Uncharacterized protein n=1 Tax=marine sediment metagenome TaxID=412755 RepID=X0W793_9ZZZZ